jgi:hypothetical protein
MYHSTGVQKLSPSQMSKLRNGHPVRIKQGSGNSLHLTDAQIKKLAQAHKRGAAYTIQMHPEQAEKHGAGIFGDIKKFALSTVRKNRDLINPIIGRARSYAKSGIQKLADKANSQVDKYTPEIEGEGIIGDIISGISKVASMSGLGAKKKRGRPKKVGKGIMSSLVKAVAPAIIDAAAGAVKGKVEGMGIKRVGRPRKKASKKASKKPKTRRVGRPRKGGALIAPGYSAGQ